MSTRPLTLPARAPNVASMNTEQVAQQVSPGNPHKHSFEVSSPAGTWDGPGRFVVHRPTRREQGLINATIAAKMTAGGTFGADMLNDMDGRIRVTEAYLSVMLDDAPDCWWEKLTNHQNGQRRPVSFGAVYDEDLVAVWKPVVAYLRTFPGAPLVEEIPSR